MVEPVRVLDSTIKRLKFKCPKAISNLLRKTLNALWGCLIILMIKFILLAHDAFSVVLPSDLRKPPADFDKTP